MTNVCRFCNKEFSTPSNLILHQKRAKYCIKIQAEQCEINSTNSEIENINYPCKYCKKEFTTNYNLNYHIKKCPQKDKFIISQLKEELLQKDEQLYYHKEELLKKDNELRKKDEEYKDKLRKKDEEYKDELYKKDNELRKKDDEIKNIAMETELRIMKERDERTTSTIEEIAKQPKQVTTNNNQNKILIQTPIDMSKKNLERIINSDFTCDYLLGGQKGAANFVSDKILKDEKGQPMYLCCDPSRQIFQYKNERGDIEKDVKAMKLTQSLFDAGLKQKTHSIASEKMLDGDSDAFMIYTDCWQGIREMEDDNSAFRTQLSALTTK